MSATRPHSSLHRAKSAKDDEFYTQLPDINRELRSYKDHFKDKVVFLNCDDPDWSSFWVYFRQNFSFFGLKKLVATHYNPTGGASYKLILSADDARPDGAMEPHREEISGDGDFRSPESVELLREADIVVTNPPFSLFREYINQLMAHGKKLVVIGSQNAITYKEIWPLIEKGQLWMGGYSGNMAFKVPAHSESKPTRSWTDSDGQKWRSLGNVVWFTNLDIPRRHEELVLFRRFDKEPERYPVYSNYDAIEVSRVADIPRDYDGAMGVPITFLNKHNPNQFEIVGQSRVLAAPVHIEGKRVKDFVYQTFDGTFVRPYMRVVIRRKHGH